MANLLAQTRARSARSTRSGGRQGARLRRVHAEFTDLPRVIDGASELLHASSAGARAATPARRSAPRRCRSASRSRSRWSCIGMVDAHRSALLRRLAAPAADPAAHARPARVVDRRRLRRPARGRRAARAAGGVVGRKVGLTSWRCSASSACQPDYGYLTRRLVAGGAGCAPARMIAPRLEAELAFVLDRALAGPGVTAGEVLAATRAVVPVLELIDSRVRDWQITLADTIADNASSGASSSATARRPLGGLDLRTVGLVLERDGEVLATAAGAAVLGHPARAVAWLASALGRTASELPAGQLVLSGSLHRRRRARPGSYRASFGRLGAVEVADRCLTRDRRRHPRLRQHRHRPADASCCAAARDRAGADGGHRRGLAGPRRARASWASRPARDGIDAVLERDDIPLVFDATSAKAHRAPRPAAARRRASVAVDLTPAAVGPYVVPSVNLGEHLDAPQRQPRHLRRPGDDPDGPRDRPRRRRAPTPRSSRRSRSASAGPGTRQNIDEFTDTTARGLEVVGGADAARRSSSSTRPSRRS